jgi:hypothetical protein
METQQEPVKHPPMGPFGSLYRKYMIAEWNEENAVWDRKNHLPTPCQKLLYLSAADADEARREFEAFSKRTGNAAKMKVRRCEAGCDGWHIHRPEPRQK